MEQKFEYSIATDKEKIKVGELRCIRKNNNNIYFSVGPSISKVCANNIFEGNRECQQTSSRILVNEQTFVSSLPENQFIEGDRIQSMAVNKNDILYFIYRDKEGIYKYNGESNTIEKVNKNPLLKASCICFEQPNERGLFIVCGLKLYYMSLVTNLLYKIYNISSIKKKCKNTEEEEEEKDKSSISSIVSTKNGKYVYAATIDGTFIHKFTINSNGLWHKIHVDTFNLQKEKSSKTLGYIGDISLDTVEENLYLSQPYHNRIQRFNFKKEQLETIIESYVWSKMKTVDNPRGLILDSQDGESLIVIESGSGIISKIKLNEPVITYTLLQENLRQSFFNLNIISLSQSVTEKIKNPFEISIQSTMLRIAREIISIRCCELINIIEK